MPAFCRAAGGKLGGSATPSLTPEKWGSHFLIQASLRKTPWTRSGQSSTQQSTVVGSGCTVTAAFFGEAGNTSSFGEGRLISRSSGAKGDDEPAAAPEEDCLEFGNGVLDRRFGAGAEERAGAEEPDARRFGGGTCSSPDLDARRFGPPGTTVLPLPSGNPLLTMFGTAPGYTSCARACARASARATGPPSAVSPA